MTRATKFEVFFRKLGDNLHNGITPIFFSLICKCNLNISCRTYFKKISKHYFIGLSGQLWQTT